LVPLLSCDTEVHSFTLLPLARQSASFPGNAPTWVHYSPTLSILSCHSENDGMTPSFMHSKSFYSPLDFYSKLQSGAGITVSRYHGIVRNRPSDYFSRSFSRSQRKKKKEKIVQNSTKNSFILHTQLHSLPPYGPKKGLFSILSGRSSSASTILFFQVESSSSLIKLMTYISLNLQGKKKLQLYKFLGHGIGMHCWGRPRDFYFQNPTPHVIAVRYGVPRTSTLSARVKPSPI
jgi:hypothetical protein